MFKFQLIPSWMKWAAVGIAVASLGTVIGAQQIQLATARAAVDRANLKVEQAQRQFAEFRETNQRVSRETMQAYRDLEATLTNVLKEAERVQAQEKAASARYLALRTERDRMRDELAAYAAGGGGGTPEAALAACRDRAATLGALLVDGVQLQIDLAAAAANHAADVRALRAAWPERCAP